MSKSRGNVVSPDDYVDGYGSDVLRCALLFSAPWEQGGDFDDSTSRVSNGSSPGCGGHRRTSPTMTDWVPERAVLAVTEAIERMRSTSVWPG